ncbi:MAG: hypothetical protein ACTSRW_01085 [Candidatus Helarchaeota archaeon]
MKERIISFDEYKRLLQDVSTSISSSLFERKPEFVFLDDNVRIDDFEKAAVARDSDLDDVVYVLPPIKSKRDIEEEKLLEELDQEFLKDDKILLKEMKNKPIRPRKLSKQEKLNDLEDQVYLLINQKGLVKELENYLQEHVSNVDQKVEMLKNVSFVERRLKKLKSNIPDLDDFQALKSEKIRRRINKGDMKLIRTTRSQMKDVIVPTIQWIRPKKPKISEKDMEEVKEMLKDKVFRLFCLYCQKWEATYMVKTMPEHPTCVNCGSRFLAVFTLDDHEIRKILHKKNQGKRLSKKESAYFKKAQKSATQLLDYGKIAVIAMAAHGIATPITTRILQKTREDKNPNAIYRIILETRQDFVYR